MYKLLSVLTFFLIGCSDRMPQEHTHPVCSKKETTLTFNDAKLLTKVACSNIDKQKGLMGITHLPENEGMLFVFSKEEKLNFWMKDTQIPLSIAFIDANYTIVDIQEMKALDKNNIQSARPALFAVEANKKWFSLYNVKVGDKMFIYN